MIENFWKLNANKMNYIDHVQWPAMIVTVVAAWLVTSQSEMNRSIGFWNFLASNLLWIVWGWHDGAYALVVLQMALAAINIRGAFKNATEATSESSIA